MNVNTLLADPNAIEIEKFISSEDSILIVLHTIQKAAHCPQCREPSSSLKCRYIRRLADLPWHGVAVRLKLNTRKFRCRNDICPQKVFCERLPNVAAAYARRTVRLMETLTLLAFALGGRGGSRAASQLNIPVGKDSLLRAVRSRINGSATNQQPVKVLGVDDFAFRKGVSYGTILVDLERRQPIDLLPDRSAATLSKWLMLHPEIEVISRDRSRIYADAVNTALPHVAQVADRWHLLKNLGDLVEDYFVRHHGLLREAAARIRAEQRQSQPEIVLTLGAAEKLKAVPARRRHLFDEIKKLQEEGKSLHGIARELKIARNTVRRYARCDSLPNYHAGAGRPSLVVAFADYLEQRWRLGEHNAFRLWQEIKERGFTGEVHAVRRFVQEWRKTSVGKINYSFTARGMSPRQTTKMLLNPARIKNENARSY